VHFYAKFLLSGSLESDEVEVVETQSTVDGVVTAITTTRKVPITPADALRKVLFDSGLDPVRDALAGLPAEWFHIPDSLPSTKVAVTREGARETSRICRDRSRSRTPPGRGRGAGRGGTGCGRGRGGRVSSRGRGVCSR
jgi:hypothetical protein